MPKKETALERLHEGDLHFTVHCEVQLLRYFSKARGMLSILWLQQEVMLDV